MTYEEAYAALDKVKRFVKARQKVQDKRRKTFDLVYDQLQDAYRVACVTKNHLKTAERIDNAVQKTSKRK